MSHRKDFALGISRFSILEQPSPRISSFVDAGCSPHRSMIGRRYPMPQPVRTALEQIFGTSVESIKVVEHSMYARVHFGMIATTRPNRILLVNSGDEFTSNPELVLHEYFHVLRQWNTGRLTRTRYLIESVQRGYRNNRFEREARDFAALAVERYCRYLNPQRFTSREHCT